jgi:large subunit ribosomal protein L23
MNVDQAMKIIIKPYITEKTFANVKKVNTARTIYGKKAFVQFENTEKARTIKLED